MYTVALFGAGKIGEAITGLLTLDGDYTVRVCDHDLGRAKIVASMWKNAEAHQLDLKNKASVTKLLTGCQAVLSALPYYCNVEVAELALKAGVHYLDLTEDVETTRAVIKHGGQATTALIPQCGLAPGFISIAAAHLVNSFEKIDTVKMRVGALPIYPSNSIKYNLTWSTEGLINEYGNMCEVIDDGKKLAAFPLEGLERFSLDGDEYEAFNTSGGLGTLCDTLMGRVRKLDYKSVRYPGHRDYMAFLMNELRFNEDREVLKNVFERSIATTHQDKCIILVEVRGWIKERLLQKTYASTVYNARIGSHHFGAIQITTAAGICAPLDLLLTGKTTKKSGHIKCEEISLLECLENRFGKYYKDELALKGIED